MEGMFVWIVLFAGGALLFLGILLIASEKELKNKRREVEALLSKLEGFSEGMTSAGGASSESNPSAELTELRAHNRELEKRIAGLNGDLERSRRAIQDMQATHETSDDNSAEAQEKLYESATRIRQLEDAALRQQEERQNLEAHITELEKKLSASEQSVSELDQLRARSERAEREQQELREQIRQREHELVQWQSRVNEAEQHRERLAALETPYRALVSKQAALSEKQRELQADLEAFAKLMNHADSQTTSGMPSGAHR
jgi:chromosome segregation protein